MIILIVKIRYWLGRRICRRYAREYLYAVDNHGLEWTLALIEEGQDLYGHAFNHALARAGVIDYAQLRSNEDSSPCQHSPRSRERWATTSSPRSSRW